MIWITVEEKVAQWSHATLIGSLQCCGRCTKVFSHVLDGVVMGINVCVWALWHHGRMVLASEVSQTASVILGELPIHVVHLNGWPQYIS